MAIYHKHHKIPKYMGGTDAEIGTMFKDAPMNCNLPEEWIENVPAIAVPNGGSLCCWQKQYADSNYGPGFGLVA